MAEVENPVPAAVRAPAPDAELPLLAVEDLSTHFFTREGVVRAVDEVSFHVRAGESMAIVGESGCGKSVTALSILRLIAPPGRVVKGRVVFEGEDLLRMREAQMQKIRGDRVAMIFQEPMSSLNPVMSIGRQIAESFVLHRGLSHAEAGARALEMLRQVHIPEPERRLRQYPHELSGGMRQRVMIAMAIACGPRLLIADEPTTALDVTIQAQILDLIREMQTKIGAATILITHDLGVVAENAQRVAVMYAGRKVEDAPVADLFARPRHPYTRALMQAMPRLSRESGKAEKSEETEQNDKTGLSPGEVPAARRRLAEIPGMVPNLREPIIGCAFAARCPERIGRCELESPPL